MVCGYLIVFYMNPHRFCQAVVIAVDSSPLTPSLSVGIIIHPLGLKYWLYAYNFIGSTDTEVEAPILWLPDVKSQIIGKDPDAGKD